MGATLEKDKLGLVDPTSQISRYLAVKNDKVEVQDNTGATVMGIEAHAVRHASGGDDAIGTNALKFSQVDKGFDPEQTKNVGAGSTLVIDKGIYYARTGANTTVEYSYDGGTNWQQLIAASGAGLVISDGANVRFNNSGGVAEDSYLLPIQ